VRSACGWAVHGEWWVAGVGCEGWTVRGLWVWVGRLFVVAGSASRRRR